MVVQFNFPIFTICYSHEHPAETTRQGTYPSGGPPRAQLSKNKWQRMITSTVKNKYEYQCVYCTLYNTHISIHMRYVCVWCIIRYFMIFEPTKVTNERSNQSCDWWFAFLKYRVNTIVLPLLLINYRQWLPWTKTSPRLLAFWPARGPEAWQLYATSFEPWTHGFVQNVGVQKNIRVYRGCRGCCK